MARFEKHVFICTNERPAGHPKGCCKEKGSEQVRDAMKKEIAARGMNKRIRINASGCLDACEFGVAIVVYPEAIWYGGVRVEDVSEIIESHLTGNVPVERLRIRNTEYSPDLFQGE